ncbi:MAG TPA: hypothetical protein VM686_05800 [Polyangiaceae bacterium]|nr:hypothetical protein [Polyangiaceae bacterium]
MTCSKCGASLDPGSGAQILVCPYCQTSHVFAPPPPPAAQRPRTRSSVQLVAIAAVALLGVGGASVAFLRTGAPPPAPQTVEPQATYGVGQAVDIYWGSKWWPGRVLKLEGGHYRITYDGWSESWDEWVEPERLRPRSETK